MPRPQTTIRGVASMRTLARKRGDGDAPHQVHIRLAALALERQRREQEHNAMRERLRLIAERLDEIDAQRDELCRQLDLLPSEAGDGEAPTREISEAFCIRY